MKKTISIFGVTGSIGDSCLDVILSHKDNFDILGVGANKNVSKLIKICKKIHPKYAVIGDDSLFNELQKGLEGTNVILFSGKEALNKVASIQCDIFISAIVGIAGLEPTYNAIQAGSNIGLANKESLACAGDIIMNAAKNKGVKILPIDSEHNAIFQCIANNKESDIQSITLTASGGPFRGKTKSKLQGVTKNMALKHPNWSMGQKISIDSATMINKGLEAIEAYHLFDITPDQIEIVVHPESVIHGMVSYKDGNTLAALSPPDMRVPIAHVLGFPDRLEVNTKNLGLVELGKLTFEKPDFITFEGLQICLDILKNNLGLGCVLNAANEVAVESFLNKEIGFLDIIEVIKQTLTKDWKGKYGSIEDILKRDNEARKVARDIIKTIKK